MQSTMLVLFLVIALAWAFQGYLSYKQVRHIQKRYVEICRAYKDQYCIGFGQAKYKWLTKGCVCILVVDQELQIVHAEVILGISVFDQFKPDPELVGVDVRTLLIDEGPTVSRTVKLIKNVRPNIGKDKEPKVSSRGRALGLAAKHICDYARNNAT